VIRKGFRNVLCICKTKPFQKPWKVAIFGLPANGLKGKNI
jgi:hypothetical protein